MNILECHKVEDCFDGSAVFDYVLSDCWTESRIRRLEQMGKLEYFADFPRPLFRLRSNEGLFLNGLVGETTCRVILPERNRDSVKHKLESVINEI